MTISARLMHNKDRPLEIEERPGLDNRTVTLRAMIPYCLAALAVASGIIHFSMAGPHFQQYWLFGVATLIAAWVQLLWALAVGVRPSRMVWWRTGAIVNSGIIVLDIAARLVGGDVAGFGVLASIVLQALVVVGCAWLALGKRDYRVGSDGLVATYGTVGILTATILSISLLAGEPAKTANVSVPALDRHGLQSNVPLPAGVSFAGVHQSVLVPDMQYHSNTSIDTWGWTVSGRGTVAVQNFYETALAKHGWTHIQGQSVMDKIGNHGRCQLTQGCQAAKHLTACRSGQVLLVSASSTTLDTADINGHVTAKVTAPRGGAALLIQIDRSPQTAQVVCPNSR